MKQAARQARTDMPQRTAAPRCFGAARHSPSSVHLRRLSSSHSGTPRGGRGHVEACEGQGGAQARGGGPHGVLLSRVRGMSPCAREAIMGGRARPAAGPQGEAFERERTPRQGPWGVLLSRAGGMSPCAREAKMEGRARPAAGLTRPREAAADGMARRSNGGWPPWESLCPVQGV